MKKGWRAGMGLLCVALMALGAGPASAWGDANDPLPGFPFHGGISGNDHGGFEGPCGLAVDSLGNFYVADYYDDEVKAFEAPFQPLVQIPEEDPLDGPCGLAVGVSAGVNDAGTLYVNNFHRNVVGYRPTSFPFLSPPFYEAGTTIESAESTTGVAVDPVTGDVYVDERTAIAVYDPPVEAGDVPVSKIGAGGSLEDGYGVAVSGHSGSDEGFVYVPDAATGTVKVYDPATNLETPIDEIDGHETPEGGFVSLRDAAVAVDKSSGLVYVADNLQPEYHEHPEAAVYAFQPNGTYAGQLKYNVVDAQPPGLAIGGGRVYVTSGDSFEASVIAYTVGALVKSAKPPLEPGALQSTAAVQGEAPAPAALGALPAAAVGSLPSSRPRSRAAALRRARHRHRHRHRRRHRARHERR